MAQIGQFTRDKSGFTGRIQTLCLLPMTSPSFRPSPPMPRMRPTIGSIMGDGDGPEIGAGWKRTGEKAGEYVSLVIDDPALAQPIRANLFQSGDDKSAWVLNWNRPPKRSERG